MYDFFSFKRQQKTNMTCTMLYHVKYSTTAKIQNNNNNEFTTQREKSPEHNNGYVL